MGQPFEIVTLKVVVSGTITDIVSYVPPVDHLYVKGPVPIPLAVITSGVVPHSGG